MVKQSAPRWTSPRSRPARRRCVRGRTDCPSGAGCPRSAKGSPPPRC